MLPLVDALDTFLEAARKVNKQRALKPVQRKLERGMAKAFAAQGRAFLKAFTKVEGAWPVQESTRLRRYFLSVPDLREAIDDGDLEPFFNKSLLETLKLFKDPLEAAVSASLLTGSKAILGQIGMKISFKLGNPRAVDYLKAHGADLVKQIDETTRTDIRYVVEYGLDNGWSYQKTAQAIQQRYKGYYDTGSWWNFDAPRPQGHIDSRAHLLSVTESGNAYEAGNFMVIQDLTDAGLKTEKAWSTMGDDRVSDGCQENEDEGWIDADQAHQSGHMHPLRHPGCRCDELYRTVS